MGIPLLRPLLVYGDNMSVIHNTQIPLSTLRKKINSICYHEILESAAMGESITAWVPTVENPDDLLTKFLYRSKRRHILGNVLCDIYYDH